MEIMDNPRGGNVRLRDEQSDDTLSSAVAEHDRDMLVTGPSEGVFRVTLDLPKAEVVDMAVKVLAFRKAMAKARGIKNPGRMADRKQLLETWATNGALEYLSRLTGMFDRLGPLPDPDDKQAMDAYAQRALDFERQAAAAPVPAPSPKRRK